MGKISKYVLVLVFFCILFPFATFAGDVVSIPSRGQDYVNDFAGLLNYSDKVTIAKFAAELEGKTTAQIAIVTIKTTKPETIQGFSVRLFDQWKIGQKGEDNGVLLLMAVDDRKAWITTGYGVEGAIPDLIANKIVRDVMIPYFKHEQYSEGITKGAVAIISLVAKEYNVEITGYEAQVYQTVHRKKSGLEVVFIILLSLFFVSMCYIGGRRRAGYWYGTGLGSGGSGGGFSGGFGGFGGGMSGGGGGGGGW